MSARSTMFTHSRLIARTMLLLLSALAIADTGAAQEQRASWLSPPVWGSSPEAILASETGATSVSPRANRRIEGHFPLVSHISMADGLKIERLFYFDAKKQLRLVQIVPTEVGNVSCMAMRTAIANALGRTSASSVSYPAAYLTFYGFVWMGDKDRPRYELAQFVGGTASQDRSSCYFIIRPAGTGKRIRK